MSNKIWYKENQIPVFGCSDDMEKFFKIMQDAETSVIIMEYGDNENKNIIRYPYK